MGFVHFGVTFERPKPILYNFRNAQQGVALCQNAERTVG